MMSCLPRISVQPETELTSICKATTATPTCLPGFLLFNFALSFYLFFFLISESDYSCYDVATLWLLASPK